MIGVLTMAKKGQKDESKYQHEVTDDSLDIVNDTIVRKTKTINSQRKAIKKYEQSVEYVGIRLPKGSKAKINQYITESQKYKSLNAMIKSLIEKEIGQSLDC